MSLPHRRVRVKLLWFCRASGSMRPQGTRVIVNIFYFHWHVWLRVWAMGNIDTPTHTQEDCVESDISAFQLFAKFTVVAYTQIF
eukprot:1156008-Pelagomonas_calceolata.AAC.4